MTNNVPFLWYVDDIKVIHEEETVVKDIMEKINGVFGGLYIKIGKEQTYLGMDIKFNDDQTVSIKMEDYINEVISAFDNVSHVSSSIATPAIHNLFASLRGHRA